VPRLKDGEGGCVDSGDSNDARCVFPALCNVPAGETTGTCTVPTFIDCPAVRPDPPAGGYPPGMDPWCPSLDYPSFCPGHDDVPSSCWGAHAVCMSTVNCKGAYHACTAANEAYDCQVSEATDCVPACAPAAVTATACEKCTIQKCCGSVTACNADPMCATGKTGPAWTTLMTCQATYCADDCP
jgi:hypothetical protein